MTLLNLCNKSLDLPYRCGKKFAAQYHLTLHVRTVHEGIKRSSTCTCSECLLTFKDYKQLHKHKVLEHNKEHKEYQCQLCGKKDFPSYSHLQRHMVKHEEPSFKCRFCEKLLKTQRSLLVHEMEHTGERPFKCTVCGNGYKSRSLLASHMKLVHKILTPRMKPIEKRVRKNKD